MNRYHRVCSTFALALAAGALTTGCNDAAPVNTGGVSVVASASAAPTAAPTPPPSPGASAPSAPEPTREEAHRFVMLGAACWFGGVWADAEGEAADRKAATEARCREVVRKIYGNDDTAKLERFRALEPQESADFASRVDAIATNDAVDGARKERLTKLATALADAQREAMHARRAAEKVRRDEEKAEREKLNDDEVKAVGPLRAHAALDALLSLDAGDLSKEANALGVLAVMERVNIARGLPKHLKMYAWADALKALFGVAVPEMPEDATKKLPKGLLLSYVTDAAKAAGHPLPEALAKSTDAKAKYAVAYAGILEGMSDKLKADLDGVSEGTELHQVVVAVKNRLEAEYNAEKNAHAGPSAAGGAKPARNK